MEGTNIQPMFELFKLSNEEYRILEKKFDDLCKFAAWQLKRKNAQNNLSEDVEDYIQDLRFAVVRAGVYYKRQVYIENCLNLAEKYAADSFTKRVVEQLVELWKARKKHGASRQKFGQHQERLLNAIVGMCVPEDKRPNPKSELQIDNKFKTYCKQITWNQQKSLGRKITRERSLRNGMVSLSEYDFLSTKIN